MRIGSQSAAGMLPAVGETLFVLVQEDVEFLVQLFQLKYGGHQLILTVRR